jgi:hypothetical protein
MELENSESYLDDDEDDLDEYLEESLNSLDKISGLQEFMEFCKELNERVDEDDVPNVIIESQAEHQKYFEQLKAFNYPADFLEWHEKHGHVYLWLETTKVVQSKTVLEELHSDWFSLLTHNGFLFLTTDAAGNAYVIDTNVQAPQIKFAAHEEMYFGDATIPNIYSEFYEFEVGADGQIQKNPKNLDTNLIFDENGSFISDSVYLEDYYAQKLKSCGCTSFLEFLKERLRTGLIEYYVLDV